MQPEATIDHAHLRGQAAQFVVVLSTKSPAHHIHIGLQAPGINLKLFRNSLFMLFIICTTHIGYTLYCL